MTIEVNTQVLESIGQDLKKISMKSSDLFESADACVQGTAGSWVSPSADICRQRSRELNTTLANAVEQLEIWSTFLIETSIRYKDTDAKVESGAQQINFGKSFGTFPGVPGYITDPGHIGITDPVFNFLPGYARPWPPAHILPYYPRPPFWRQPVRVFPWKIMRDCQYRGRIELGGVSSGWQ